MRLPRLDPDAADRVASFGDMPPMRTRGLAAVRAGLESAQRPDMPAMVGIEDLSVPGPAGPIPLRIYRPTIESRSPVVVYLHGGGLVMGTNHSFEPLARELAHASGAAVVAVEYRLAPEAPPPAQFEDAYAATEWVSSHGDDLDLDVGRLAVVGDSAGGSLAAAVALAARDRNSPPLCAQVLLYPGLDRDLGAASITSMPDAPMLRRDDILYMHELVDGEAGSPHDPRRLSDAGVQTTLTRYPGVYHGFLMRSDSTARGRLAIAEIGALLRAKFAHLLNDSPDQRTPITLSEQALPTIESLTTEGEHHADR
ncbi:alpha/beta hydrolase [Mycolicibacterium sarraceniae]|uniref:Alpha/beta hydrolase n=1 Tax=Mycolicibacterium sarraceniae TaxID=1534348 RepID=A0A7I7SW34_9MYCO|nr:alpha/beta hydrolase [Mycolicibacterium sarraceniae]BBY61008.1 alpha/beta hydrolase [Mycolicibacterium sarraceniae]